MRYLVAPVTRNDMSVHISLEFIYTSDPTWHDQVVERSETQTLWRFDRTRVSLVCLTYWPVTLSDPTVTRWPIDPLTHWPGDPVTRWHVFNCASTHCGSMSRCHWCLEAVQYQTKSTGTLTRTGRRVHKHLHLPSTDRSRTNSLHPVLPVLELPGHLRRHTARAREVWRLHAMPVSSWPLCIRRAVHQASEFRLHL